MFRPLRRKGQLMPEGEAYGILEKASSGVLALVGDGGYPYAVPVSYVLSGNKIYIHSAPEGHKIDAICQNEKASFCVISEDNVVPERFTTRYRSVICFGKIRLVTDEKQRLSILRSIANKYSPGFEKECEAEISEYRDSVALLEFTIEHMTGKESRELMEERHKGK